ncbi:MAG: MFS transporter [Bacillota bacterium]|jgi:predicted MFS family arabinose efflux permease
MEASTINQGHNKRYELTIVILFFLTWGFVFLDRLSISFLLPVIQPALGINNMQVGILGFVTTGAYAISAIGFGALSDRSGFRKRWLVLFVFITAASTALCALAQNYAHLLILRTIVGIGEGPLFALMMSILARNSSENAFGRNAGIVNVGVGLIAVTLGPIMVTQLVAYFTWQLTFLLTALPSVVIAFLLMIFVRELKVLSGEDAQNQDLQKMKAKRGGVLTILSQRNILLCTIISFGSMAGYWALSLYAPLYLTNIAGLTVQEMGFVTSVMGILYMVYSFLVPKLSDNFGRKPALIVFYALCILAPLIMALSPGTGASVWAYMLFGGVPGAMTPVFAVLMPMETVADNMRATAQGTVNGVGEFFGGSLMPIATGRLADLYGLPITMAAGAGFFALCFIVSLFVKETNPYVLAKRKKAAA